MVMEYQLCSWCITRPLSKHSHVFIEAFGGSQLVALRVDIVGADPELPLRVNLENFFILIGVASFVIFQGAGPNICP